MGAPRWSTSTWSTAASHVARRGGRPPRPPRIRPAAPEASTRPLLAAHLAWSTLIVLVAGALLLAELTATCPPGGPLALGDCERVRPLAVATVALAAVLYVGGLSAVLVWTGGLIRRRTADAGTARDWYLLAAGVGLPAVPLLAFTLVSAFR